MAYRYETHLHTCQGSACGHVTGSEHVAFYKEKGYQGIMVTDHFFGSISCIVPKSGSWKERIDFFCAGYEDAFIEGQRRGLDVFFGWEAWFEGDEYLVYGLDKQWLLAHPEVENWTRAEQLREVHRYGGCVIQAHPFRKRGYIPRVLLGLNYSDGVEIANAANQLYSDAYAEAYVRKYGLRTVAGTDNHGSEAQRVGVLMGVETDERLTSISDYVKLIRWGGALRPIMPKDRFEQGRKDAPELETFWLDENECAVPTGIRWLD